MKLRGFTNTGVFFFLQTDVVERFSGFSLWNRHLWCMKKKQTNKITKTKKKQKGRGFMTFRNFDSSFRYFEETYLQNGRNWPPHMCK